MPAWIARPGRALGLLEALGVWAVVLAVLSERVVEARGSAHFTASVLFIGAMAAVMCWEHERPRGLLAFVRADRWQVWLPALPVVFWMALESPISAWLLPVVAAGILASAAAAAWQLVLARRAATWVTGQLRVTGDGARLETETATFILDRAPYGLEDGDSLTLPQVEIIPTEAGPYRTGRAIGRAPEVWRASGQEIARRLALRGVVLLVWAGALTFWMV